MIFAICVVICVTLLIYYFIYKKWSDAVKIVGKSILKIVKPLYKFLFKVFPISVVLISIATLVLAVALMVTAIQRSVENKDNTENAESVEDVKYDDISFVEKFFDRAENRAVNFLDGLARMGNSFNKFIGIEEGKDNETPEFGIEYIITESHGILYADPTPIYGTFAPIVSPEGVIAFGRDIESSKQVWSSICGYPGDFNYREFYRDIGYDADYEYIKPYIAKNGVRVNTGIKYHRITGKTEFKDYYNVQWAMDSAEKQAGHFLDSRTNQINELSSFMETPPIVVCPYDAELYGHWWYEGPLWLYTLFKKVHYDKCDFAFITPGEYIDKYPEMQESSICRSSWGANGYNGVWLNQTNDYVHRHLHKAGDQMVELAHLFSNEQDKLKKLALNQCARELLLAQSSDWLFIITNGTMVDYAKKRIKDHIGRFTKLYNDLKNNTLNEKFLKDINTKDPIFPEIDYMIFY